MKSGDATTSKEHFDTNFGVVMWSSIGIHMVNMVFVVVYVYIVVVCDGSGMFSKGGSTWFH